MSIATGLTAWLPQQRWFGGKGRSVTSLDASGGEPIASTDDLILSVVVARVHYDDGGSEDYQVLLSGRPQPWGDIEHAYIGEVGGTYYYDAPHDPHAMTSLLDALRDGTTTADTSFHRIGEIGTELRARLVGAEQSNTSIVFGEELILKVFRRLAPGVNPDLELTRALQEAGSEHVAPVHGWIEQDRDGAHTTLAVLQRFAPSASEGWALALTSVRDLYAEADLHADEVGGDFAAEAHRLGAATAEVHRLLARALPTVVADPEAIAGTATAMEERLERAAAEVPELARHVGALRARYAALRDDHAKPVVLQRVHGDYHLGQVLRTDGGWLLLDFEGEPARPLAERRAPASPLRDVAGMLRSFDYAAQSALIDHPRSPGLEYRALEWAERNAEAFCDGYGSVAGHDPRDDLPLLRAFELDKAVYEVVYEARHRPSWLPIPLTSIARLAA